MNVKPALEKCATKQVDALRSVTIKDLAGLFLTVTSIIAVALLVTCVRCCCDLRRRALPIWQFQHDRHGLDAYVPANRKSNRKFRVVGPVPDPEKTDLKTLIQWQHDLLSQWVRDEEDRNDDP